MKTRLAILTATLAVAMATYVHSATAASVRTVTKSYQLGIVGEVDVLCQEKGGLINIWTNPSSGGACFGLQFGEVTVTVTIEDEKGWPVGAFYDFTDPLGHFYGSGYMCQEAVLPIPTASTTLIIDFTLESIIYTSCGLSIRPATSGTITAEFYKPWP